MLIHHCSLLPLAFAGVVLPVASAQCEPSWDPRFPFPGTGSPTDTLCVFDDGSGSALFVGGTFAMAGGIAADHVARWDGVNWSNLQGGIDGSVRATIVFDDGGGAALYAGGFFSSAGAIAASNVARWSGSGWSAVGNDVAGTVDAFAVHDGALYAAVNASGTGTVMRWSGASWTAAGSAFGGPIHALASFDSALYAGGAFSAAGGVLADNVARWNGTSWSAVAGGTDDAVRALEVFEGALFAGGFFDNAGGSPASSIARWSGTAWSGVGGGVTGSASLVLGLAVFDDGSGSALYAGGGFTSAGSVPANAVAKWNGSAWSALGDGIAGGGLIAALEPFDGALHVVGEFTQAGGRFTDRIARWNGSAWSALGHGVDGPITALATCDTGAGSALHAAGHFRFVGGMPAAGIARWDGGEWSPLGSGFPFNGVNALIEFDDGSGPALYAGGEFGSVGGITTKGIARWNGASWSAVGGGITGARVDAFAVFDDGAGSALYAAGSFASAGGVDASSIARWNGSTWSALGIGVGGSVASLAVFDDGSGSQLYAGGFITSAGGLAATGIARWDGATWSTIPGPGFGLQELAVFENELYAAGSFASIGGVPVANIARWNGSAWSAVGSGVNNLVDVLRVFDDGTGPGLYVGGHFTIAGGEPANRIARWDGAMWSPLGVGIGGLSLGGNAVRALAVFEDGSDGAPDLYAGGAFSHAGGLGAGGIAEWRGCHSAIGSFCFGDGARASCPCANNGAAGHGCANSFFASGGRLAGSGVASVGSDSVRLSATNLTGLVCLFFQGTASVTPVAIDDGLGCVGGSILRLGLRSVTSASSSFPQPGDFPISTAGAIPPLGGTRYYQAFYRNAASFCTPATTNRTNGVVVEWTP